MLLTQTVAKGYRPNRLARGVTKDRWLGLGGSFCWLAICLGNRFVAGIVIMIVIARRRSAGSVDDRAEEFRLLDCLQTPFQLTL